MKLLEQKLRNEREEVIFGCGDSIRSKETSKRLIDVEDATVGGESSGGSSGVTRGAGGHGSGVIVQTARGSRSAIMGRPQESPLKTTSGRRQAADRNEAARPRRRSGTVPQFCGHVLLSLIFEFLHSTSPWIDIKRKSLSSSCPNYKDECERRQVGGSVREDKTNSWSSKR